MRGLIYWSCWFRDLSLGAIFRQAAHTITLAECHVFSKMSILRAEIDLCEYPRKLLLLRESKLCRIPSLSLSKGPEVIRAHMVDIDPLPTSSSLLSFLVQVEAN